MMTSALLRQLIREQIEGLLLEAATFEPYQVQSIDDIDAQQVLARAMQTGFIHPVFVGEALESAEAFNQGVSSQRWSRLYTGADGMEHLFRGNTPVKYSTGDWVVVPALYGRDRTYGGLLQISEQGNMIVSDRGLLGALKTSGVISGGLDDIAIPFVRLTAAGRPVARMFIHKITGKSKSLEEAEASLDFWLDRRADAQAAAERAEKRAAAGAARGGSTRAAPATPTASPAPNKPADPWAKLAAMRAKK